MRRSKKISALIITFNEELNIDRCLQSIKWVDEIVIVDSFSSDNTISVGKKYTHNIYSHKFDSNFSIIRNFGIDKVKNEWIIVLDADEFFSNNAELIIRQLISNNNVDGYLFPRRNYINKNNYLKYGYFYPDYQLRLFKNIKKIRYYGQIHEQPIVEQSMTKIINYLEIYHNCSHTKYDSITSFYRFFPYIRIEAYSKAKNVNSSILLIKVGLMDIIKNFYNSFFKLKGYLDGYLGFRAALLHSFYLGSISLYAALIKIRRKV